MIDDLVRQPLLVKLYFFVAIPYQDVTFLTAGDDLTYMRPMSRLISKIVFSGFSVADAFVSNVQIHKVWGSAP